MSSDSGPKTQAGRATIGAMTPEEFRAAGHRIVDWIADYRARVATLPVMARTEPGDVKRAASGIAADRGRSLRSDRRGPRSHRRAGPLALAAPALLRVLPEQRPARQRARRLRQHRVSACSACRGSRALRSPRSRKSSPTGCGRCSDCRDEWTGVIQDTASTSTLVALISARERISRLRLEPRRPAGRAAAARRLRLGARPQFRGQGGAAGRLRAATTFTSCRPMRRTR